MQWEGGGGGSGEGETDRLRVNERVDFRLLQSARAMCSFQHARCANVDSYAAAQKSL